MMKYGVYAPTFGDTADPRILANLAQESEGAGWDGFFIYDHIARENAAAVADPWITLAAIAASTSRIRIGALITPLARRRPWKVARETASLDILSGGRLIMGVGVGHRRAEFDAFGEQPDIRVRSAMLDEALEVITGLWTGQPYGHRGNYYTVDTATFVPTPIQQPRVPIWVAGRWPGTRPFRRAARWEGVFPLPVSGSHDRPLKPLDYRSMLTEIARHRGDAATFDVVHLGHTDMAIAADEQVAAYRSAGVTWWLEDLYASALGAPGIRPIRQRILAGPPK